MGEKVKKFDKKVWLFALGGIVIGIILFAGTAGALNATDTPGFCGSCHVYEHTVLNFNNSSHANLNCNDCHTPNDTLMGKYTYKAKSAIGHVYMTTLGAKKLPDVIHASTDTKNVTQQNCLDCHSQSMKDIVYDPTEKHCIDCHRYVPHGKGDFRPAEWYETGDFSFRSTR